MSNPPRYAGKFGVVTMTPYDYWKRMHAGHHASSGNLDHRGIGDIDTLTVREYLDLGCWRRLLYRLYRHPIVMFGLGPTYMFLLQHRAPVGLMRGAGWKPWASTMSTNAGIVAIAAGGALGGYRPSENDSGSTGRKTASDRASAE